MAVREIVLLGNPVLRAESGQVKTFADPDVCRTIEDLSDTLEDFRATHGFGRGIAAPQIGVSKRIVFIHVDEPMPLINPIITRRSRQLMTLWDDCFSFPDIVVKVKRHVRISVSYQDESGRERSLDAVGSLSELLQHEIDHVNGILAIDRAIDSKHVVLRSEYEKFVKGKGSGIQF